jgi:hypothetical protein
VKWGVVSLLLTVLLASAVHGQSHKKIVFFNMDDNSTGWGSCTSCAGGANNADVYWMAQFQTTPSRDGNSTQFYISARQPYSHVLFWEKLGAQDWATQFTWDFWVYLDNASLGPQALEYDLFQFVGGVEYMFDTECTYGNWLLEYMEPRGGDLGADPGRLSPIHRECLAPHHLANPSNFRHANALRFADTRWKPVFPEPH